MNLGSPFPLRTGPSAYYSMAGGKRHWIGGHGHTAQLWAFPVSCLGPGWVSVETHSIRSRIRSRMERSHGECSAPLPHPQYQLRLLCLAAKPSKNRLHWPEPAYFLSRSASRLCFVRSHLSALTHPRLAPTSGIWFALSLLLVIPRFIFFTLTLYPSNLNKVPPYAWNRLWTFTLT